MAVQLVNDTRKFVGLSSDTKPRLASKVYGGEFTELDTGQKFIWDGDNWIEDLTLYFAVKTALEEAG